MSCCHLPDIFFIIQLYSTPHTLYIRLAAARFGYATPNLCIFNGVFTGSTHKQLISPKRRNRE